ncbi:DUF7927 domain-containing protein [Breznakia pachnodae]|uniref:Repeat protein (TIGR01451 family) n=1 Tax=Breznakia pachnodae TaxID=265178 RepID=A0ABU0E1T3_9FIRM|nr:SdrD B-like domain-containing protein [Breznakia pachnodae]MDQ0360776.1 putative repeat protein (TIGR01451 family) [Breznakia pachnodae]
MKKLKKISIVMILMTMIVGMFASDILLADDLLEPETSEVSETPDSEEVESMETTQPESTESTEETTKTESEIITTEEATKEQVQTFAAGFVENTSPSDIPTYYESKPITTGDGTVLYYFKGRNNNTYYRIYGSQDGAADAFYETNSQGTITSTTTIDTDSEKLTIAPYIFVGETYTSVPTTITKEDTISTTARYDVYSFDGADGNKIYVAYGYISNVNSPETTKGWYELDDTTHIVKDFTDGKQEDIDKYVLNKANNGFEETTAPSTIPDYYNTPVKLEADKDTLVTRERVYAFTGKDGVTYYRVYGTVNSVNEGFYVADQYGNVIAPENKIDLVEEEKNLKWTDSKPGEGLVSDSAYVSSIEISEVRDGTPVWDTDDAPGNDSGSSNGIVRTFDTIGYLVDANIQIRSTSEYTSFTSGYGYFRVTLPVASDIAEFDLDNMKWIVDAKVEVIDGKQVLTGKRFFSAEAGKNVFPGTRQFPFEIKVNAAINGDIIKPTFEVWMDGNPESDYKSVSGDDVVVSAAPKYNIFITEKSSYTNTKGSFDLDSGEMATSSSTNTVYGRAVSFGVGIQILNDSKEKGIKGIELPKDNLSFDLKLKVERQVSGNTSTLTDVTSSYTPVLWDYKLHNTSSSKGTLGRNIRLEANSHFLPGLLPFGDKNGSTSTSKNIIKNKAGTFTITGTGDSLSVNLSGFSIDTPYVFPVNNASDIDTTIRYEAHQANFSALQCVFIIPMDEEPTDDYEYYFTIDDSNFEATSKSDTKVTTQAKTTDDSKTLSVPERIPGSYEKYNYHVSESGKNLATDRAAGDAWTYPGNEIYILGYLLQDKADPENEIYSFNFLQKFDDEAYEISSKNNISIYPESDVNSQNMPKQADISVLYAAKPDKTGWLDDNEMLNASEADLIYYNNISDLNADGYTCVGVLFESRTGYIPSGGRLIFKIPIKIKEDAEVGKVYQTVNEWRGWATDVNLDEDQSVQNGNMPTTQTVYLSPRHQTRYKYSKTVYDGNGKIVSGSHSGSYNAGQSLLIIGNNAKITKGVAQHVSGKAKSLFDLDAGEREVDYVLQPSLELANGEKPSSEILDQVTVVDTLPYNTEYIVGSTVIGGTYNQDTQSVDGGDYSTGVQPVVGVGTDSNGRSVQTLTWTFTDVKVGDIMDKIYYSVIIGNAANPDIDAKNADSFTNTVKIYADSDGRVNSVANGNQTSAGFTVVKTNATTFAKGIDQNMYELGEDIGYFLNYANASPNIQNNIRILDIMPYSGDWRGTKFDGTYTVDTITLEYSATPTTTLDLKYSTDESMKNQSNNAYNVNTSSFIAATKSVSGTTVTYTLPSGTKPTSIYLTGSLDGKTSIKISYKLKVTENKPANIYANDATVVSGTSEDPLYAPVVQAKVVRRTVEGVAWIDSNRNGKRETSERKLPDVKVSLYKSDGTQVTTDILGNSLTGVVTDANGAYSFTNLPSGIYYVQFDSSGTVDLSKYTLTTKQASGVSSTVNSDADAVLDGSGNLLSAKITGITTPAIEDMKVMDYRMSNLDMGVYAPYTVEKASNPTGSYDGSDVPIVKEGQIVTYTITVDSPTANQSNLTMTDKLPDGMSLVSGSITYKLQGGAQVKVNDSAYNSSTGTITWPTLEVPKGKSEYTFKAIVDKVDWEENETERVYENIAIAKQPDIPDQPSNSVEHKTIRREADITKAAALVNEDNTVQSENNGTASSPVYSELEQTIEYRLVIKNTGHDDAKSGDIVITDNLPLDTTYIASSMTYEFRDSSNTAIAFPSSNATATMSGPDSSGKMTWTLTGMSSGEEVYLTFRVKAPTTSDNPATLLVKELEKEFNNTAHLKDVQREETVYETTYTDVDGNTYKENESVYSEKEISKDSNTTYHVVKEPLLTITKVSDVEEGSYVSSGDEITYSITVKNVGKATAKEIDIKDAIPEYTTYVPGTINFSGDATTVTPSDTAITDGTGELTWKIEGLAVEKSVIVTFTVKVDEMYESGEREILNQAYTRLPEDPWEPSEEVEHKQKVAYEIEKYSNPETGSYVDGNQEITYFIKITNTGESSLDKAQVKDAIPEHTTYVEGSVSYEGDADVVTPDDSTITDGLGELTWDIENVPVGKEVILSFKVKVDEMYETGERSIKNVAYVKAPEDPWDPSEEVEHKQKVSYEIEKSSNPESGSYVDGGDKITYYIKVTNTGESSLDNLQVKDAIPEYTTYVEESIAYEGSADFVTLDDTNIKDGLGELTWDIENVPEGETITLSFKVKVDELNTEGERDIKNQAYAKTPKEEEWTPSNEVEHKQGLEYTIKKSSNPEPDSILKSGDYVTYFIHVENTGSETLREIKVMDKVPTGTEYEEESIYSTFDNTKTNVDETQLTWEIEEIEPGAIAVVSFRVKVTGDQSTIRNIAQVQHKDNDPKDTNEIIHTIEPKKSASIAGNPSIATGDTVNVNSLLSLLIISMSGIIILFLKQRKQAKNK